MGIVFWADRLEGGQTFKKKIALLNLKIIAGFLSPARRGRGILVAPGFCLASGVTFSCGRKNYWSNLFEILT